VRLEGEFKKDEIVFGKIFDKEGSLYETMIDEINDKNNGKIVKSKLFGLVKVFY
jgi:hypothetical protein